jgi:hypothetical protein
MNAKSLRHYATNSSALGQRKAPANRRAIVSVPKDPQPPAPEDRPESEENGYGARINRLFREAIRDLNALRRYGRLEPSED